AAGYLHSLFLDICLCGVYNALCAEIKRLFKSAVKYVGYIHLCALIDSRDEGEQTDRSSSHDQNLVARLYGSTIDGVIAYSERLYKRKLLCAESLSFVNSFYRHCDVLAKASVSLNAHSL